MERTTQKRGFKALLATQFLGAFNDNAFKLVISLLAVDLFVGKTGGTQYLSIAGVIFILPFLLFSAYAGFISDRFSKQKIIVVTKALELFVMVLGFLALLKGNISAIFLVLFLMGLQSTFFSPAKYGILPELLSDKDLSEGNGAIQLWTYMAIILGTVCGGYLFYITKAQVYKASFVFIAISILGILTSVFVTKVKPSGSERRFEWNFIKEIFRNVKKIKSDRPIFLSILGLVYFGLLGGLFQLNIILYTRKVMEVSQFYTGLLLTTVALGLGIGSAFAGKLSGRKIEFGLVPLGAIGLSVFSIILGFKYSSFISVAICLFILGISGGFYIVPLNAFVQQKSPEDRRGQILATMNFLSFSAILLASVVLFVLREIAKLNAAQIFVVSGIATIVVTVYICFLLPDCLLRFIIWLLTHSIYKIRVVNQENVPKRGGALLVCNHVSYVDWAIILASLQRHVRFMTGRNFYNSKLFGPLLKIAKAIPISNTDSPKEIINSLNAAKEALKRGDLVCIFAEGGLTRTGNILKFRKGLEHIMKDVECPIIPVHLDRIWGSIFSFEKGRYFFKVPKIIPYPVTISFGKPMPAQASAFEIRNRVLELGANAFKYRLEDQEPLPESFWREARKNPYKFCMADSTGKRMNFGKALISSVILARRIKKEFSQEETIAIMLPPSVVAALLNIAVSMAGKIPVNLNYTSSEQTLSSIIERCNIKHIITSRRFLKKMDLRLPQETIFVEDLACRITKKDKIVTALQSFVYPGLLSHRLIFGKRGSRSIDDLATIIFTSGSTGIPKGAMLTHANIKSNLEGLYQVFHVTRKDVVLGILPFFHSFGYTATLWFPLLSGIGVVYHTNPLEAKKVGEMVEEHKATILMSTPTFLVSYIHRCSPSQFKSLRIVIVGAEKLKDTIAKAFKEKFNIEPMEGYGCTELSPIVSINFPDYSTKRIRQKAYKPGKIGQPIPGVAVKILNKETLKPVGPNEDGLLLVKGPNVMKGYLKQQEETSKVIQDGWYITGDIANLDEDGFLTITDRLSRFSKIGGEMVPHIKIEEAIHSILNATEQICVVTSVPDEKKGERLIVLYTGNLNIKSLVDSLRTSGLPRLWIPAEDSFYKVESIPVLGSGKLNLSLIKQKALEVKNKE
jgi:acyl-[acyl-carrier-protein]-phospholipid O-acyltransferase/long-chain-fatty-acid--[acyl-carrier-protein] ligase